MPVTGIDYLTGERNIPVSELTFLTRGDEQTIVEERNPRLFPEESREFKNFASNFVAKFGVANRTYPPVVLREESIETIRHYFENSGGRIENIQNDDISDI